MRKTLNSILLLFVILGLIHTLLAQQAPLPPKLTSAKTAAVINDGTWAKAYRKFYRALRKWNRFHLIENKEQADIVIVLSNQPGTLHAYQIRITDAKDGTLLWSDYGGAAKFLLSNSPVKLVKHLRKRFVGVPYTTPPVSSKVQ